MSSTWLDFAARPDLFAHSVVPIVVGDVVAHYLSYFVEVGQQPVVLLSDPLAKGWNLLGTRTGRWTTGSPSTRGSWRSSGCCPW
ncbi:MAG: hypothetical protein ABI776_06245 [Nocardioidaceae bacterium]